MKIERKQVPVYDFKVLDEERGVIEAIVSVTGNKDTGKDIVMPGFFADSLKTRKPKGVWGHDWLQPVAKTLQAEEWLAGDVRLPSEIKDLGGYYVKGQFNLDTQRGREAYSDIKFGIVDEFSIGYSVQESDRDKEKDARQLIKGTWFEWSPVLVGMNDQTQLISLKSADEVKGMFEDRLEERTNSFHNLCETLSFVIYQIQYMASQARDSGMTFDASMVLSEALDEFTSRLRSAVLSNLESSDSWDAYYYMGNLERLTKQISGKGEAASASTLTERSDLAASACEEFAQRSAALAGVMKTLAEDGKAKHEFRTKEGRTISQATANKITQAKTSIDEALPTLTTVSSALSDLLELAMPKEKVSPEVADALRRQTLRLQSRAVGI